MRISTDQLRKKFDTLLDRVFLVENIPAEDPRYHDLRRLVENGHPLTENEQHILSLALDNYVSNRRVELRRRRDAIESRVLYGVVVILVAWMAATYSKIDDAQKSSANNALVARNLSLQQDRIISRNRMLIRRLDRVARESQVNGARTDLRQCQEIEALKAQIRAVLREANRTDALRRFRRHGCKNLPNAKLIDP